MKSALKFGSMLLVVFLSGSCATSSKQAAAPSIDSRIDLISALKVQAGKSTKADVESLFGSAASRETKNGREVWMYRVPNSESRRLTVTFGRSGSLVESVLWVPRGSSERKLAAIQAVFPQAKFDVIEPEQNQHYIVSDVTYVDQERKILILSQKNSDQADAVSWGEPAARLPSANQ